MRNCALTIVILMLNLGEVAAQRGATGDQIAVLDVAFLCAPRASPDWKPWIGSTRWSRLEDWDLRGQARWDVESLASLITGTLFPGDWGGVGSGLDMHIGEVRLVLRSPDALLVGEIETFLDSLRREQTFVMIELTLRPAAGLAPIGRLRVNARLGEAFWAEISTESGRVPDESVGAGRGVVATDPEVAMVSTGVLVLGVPVMTTDGLALRDLRVQAVADGGMREQSSSDGQKQLSTLHESTFVGAIERLSDEETLIQLGGPGGGLLGVKVERIPSPTEPVAPPLGLLEPHVELVAPDLLIADLKGLCEPPARAPVPPFAIQPSRMPWASAEDDLLEMGWLEPPLMDEDELLSDWLMSNGREEDWFAEGAEAEVMDGRLIVRNRPDICLAVRESLLALAAAAPAPFRLHWQIERGATGEPLVQVAGGDLTLASGQRGVASVHTWIEHVQDYDAEFGEDMIAIDGIVGSFPVGSTLIVTAAALGDLGLAVDVFFESTARTGASFREREVEGHGVIELIDSRRALVWTSAHLNWNEPTVIAELGDALDRTVFTVTAWRP